MKRTCAWLLNPDGFSTLTLLPRVRLTTGRTVGVGIEWLTAWVHVWLWSRETFGRQIELLPHIWLHWSSWGSGIHIGWLIWRTHFWFYRRPAKASESQS